MNIAMNHVDEASQMINEGHVALKQYTPNTVYEKFMTAINNV